MKATIQKYLDLVLGEPRPADVRLRLLANALDELQAVISQLPDGIPFYDDREPDRRHKEFVPKIKINFPELGFYPVVDPRGSLDQPIMIGDANDDAADIASDLVYAMWYWETLSENDAVQHLQYDYQIHWGRHLIDLRSYLHALICES